MSIKKEVVQISPLFQACSPMFPIFKTAFSLSDIEIADNVFDGNQKQFNVVSDKFVEFGYTSSFANDEIGLHLLTTETSKVNDDHDLVINTFEVTQYIDTVRRIALLKLTSKNRFYGNNIYWSAIVTFTEKEWNYFLTICNLDVLQKLEDENRIKTDNNTYIVIDKDVFHDINVFISDIFDIYEVL